MMNNAGGGLTRTYAFLTALGATHNHVHTVGMVALLSGFCGFLVGIVRFPTWHHAIESAQVLAGIVHYPTDNPFYIYHTKAWSLFIQLCSAMLYVGIPERLLAYVFSGLIAMVGFQALALCTFAFCRNLLLSVAAPWLIVFCLLSGGLEFGLVYGLSVAGTHASYGKLGLSTAFLSVILFGTGNRRIGSFLLGVSPSLHASLGLFAWLVVLGCLAWDVGSEKGQLKQTIKFFALGCGVSLASLAIHFMTIPGGQTLRPELSASYLEAFLRYWNVHQKPVAVYAVGLWINVVTVVMSLSWLRRFSGLVPRTSLFILRALAVAGVLSLALAAVTWLPSNIVPTYLQRIIPGRFLSFDVFGSMAAVLGLLGSQSNLAARITLGCVAIFLPLIHFSRMEILFVARGAVMLICCLLVILVPKGPSLGYGRAATAHSLKGTSGLNYRRSRLIAVTTCIIIAVCLVPYLSSRWAAEMATCDSSIEDWSNDPFYARIHATGGMLATSSITIMQLKTRLPILLDHDINMLGYVLECGPEMERILRAVYGIDIFHPPQGDYRYGNLDPKLFREIWEARPLNEWMDIKSQFGVTQVVTFVDWELQLPEMIRNKWYKAYTIP